MFEAVGHAVSRLIRIRYGAMMLPRGLKRGVWLELDHRDIERLTTAAGMPQGGEGTPSARNTGGRGRHFGQGPRPDGKAGGSRGAGASFGNDGKRAGPGGRDYGKGIAKGAGKGAGAGGQPDPMKTSYGYIGQDSLQRRRERDAARDKMPQKGRKPGRSGGR
jgi:23S rRNA pseudouridine2605 synthase